MAPDDERIPDSMRWAKELGLDASIESADLGDVHPNTVRMELTGADGRRLDITGSSIGEATSSSPG